MSLLGVILLLALVAAQLSGPVGPCTTKEAKQNKKVCNVLDYRGVASKTVDIGPPMASAFAAGKSGGTGISIHRSVRNQT
jgi:rhamnogalacturonan hydrolase